MPSKKQRRRRDKTFRHEYEVVSVSYDEEGNEVEAPVAREKKPEKPKAATTDGKKSVKGGSRTSGRALREPSPPSWRRSIRRGGLWGGVMFVVVVFVLPGGSPAARVLTGVLYAAAFIPLTYWIDRLTYRTWQRRQAKTQ
jgi:hypothetical protein